MRNKTFSFGKMFLMLILIATLFTALSAEKLARDVNGTPIQACRTFTAVRDTIPAQAPAVYDSIAVPVNAAEVTVIFMAQHGMVYAGTAKTLAAAATDWIFVPKETPLKLPVMEGITYIKYKSYTGANNISIIWHRM